ARMVAVPTPTPFARKLTPASPPESATLGGTVTTEGSDDSRVTVDASWYVANHTFACDPGVRWRASITIEPRDLQPMTLLDGFGSASRAVIVAVRYCCRPSSR